MPGMTERISEFQCGVTCAVGRVHDTVRAMALFRMGLENWAPPSRLRRAAFARRLVGVRLARETALAGDYSVR